MQVLAEKTNRSIEINFHMDDCKAYSCKICEVSCESRKAPFQRKVKWNVKNISQLQKHQIMDDN